MKERRKRFLESHRVIKKRFKMYKAKKRWIYVPILFLGVAGGLFISGETFASEVDLESIKETQEVYTQVYEDSIPIVAKSQVVTDEAIIGDGNQVQQFVETAQVSREEAPQVLDDAVNLEQVPADVKDAENSSIIASQSKEKAKAVGVFAKNEAVELEKARVAEPENLAQDAIQIVPNLTASDEVEKVKKAQETKESIEKEAAVRLEKQVQVTVVGEEAHNKEKQIVKRSIDDEDKVTVILDTQGGKLVSSMTIPKETALDDDGRSVPIPTRTGYKFKYWSLESHGEEFIYDGIPIASDLTLYANWDPREITYQGVIYEQDIGKDSNGNLITLDTYTPVGSNTLKGIVGEKVSIPDTIPDGLFTKYNYQKSVGENGNLLIQPTETVVKLYRDRVIANISIEHAETKQKIQIAIPYGSSLKDVKSQVKKAFKLPEEQNISINIVSGRTGYKDNLVFTNNLDGDAELTIRNIIQYNFQAKTTSGKELENVVFTQKSGLIFQNMAPSIYIKNGYILKEVHINGENKGIPNKPTASIKISDKVVLIYEAKKHVVSFIDPYETALGKRPLSFTLETGEEFTPENILAIKNLGKDKRGGLEFKGWFADASYAPGTLIENIEDYQQLSADVNFYAKFSKVQKVSLFDADNPKAPIKEFEIEYSYILTKEKLQSELKKVAGFNNVDPSIVAWKVKDRKGNTYPLGSNVEINSDLSLVATVFATTEDKDTAKVAINEVLKVKEAEIEGVEGATEADKATAKNEAGKVAEEAKAAINDAETKGAVETAKADGVEKINSVVDPKGTRKSIKGNLHDEKQEINANKSFIVLPKTGSASASLAATIAGVIAAGISCLVLAKLWKPEEDA